MAIPSPLKNPMGYFWLDSWIMGNIIQLATQKFCQRFLNLHNDPCGRQFDQMTQAARSGVSNIAEGYARKSTSRETEMKLTDVARASFAELSGDFFNFLLLHGETPWANNAPEAKAILALRLTSPTFENDLRHEAARHILREYDRFKEWLDSPDAILASRALLVLLMRETAMLDRQLQSSLEDFSQAGGFAENLTKVRLSTRDAATKDAPLCPKCGKPMRKHVAKRGIRSGHEFWGCTGYPDCDGTREV